MTCLRQETMQTSIASIHHMHADQDWPSVADTSDHGYKLGQWRLGCSKEHPFETDVHTPFFASGPGIAPGTRMRSIAGNIDIAPTFFDIAGIAQNVAHDGISLMPLLREPASPSLPARRTSLVLGYIACGTYYNDHALLWRSGPFRNGSAGLKPTYVKGPYARPGSTIKPADCPASEGVGGVGNGSCYFVDSQQSNNWLAMRVRNASHNYVYIESFGVRAMNTSTPGDPDGKGVFRCLAGDHCQHELYDYGPITSDYPNFPVMTDERWCVRNSYKASSAGLHAALHRELKDAYCGSRRLPANRMGCPTGSSPWLQSAE